jgi:hypothetical protein
MSPAASLLVRLLVLAGALGTVAGCAAMSVKPWDRDLLAEPAMNFQPVPVEAAVDQHIYFSREGSTGGQEVGGGGCGCN